MKNSKRDRFLKIAPNRTNKIIDMIRLLGNCSNLNNYEYTEEEVKKIFDAIRKELNAAENRFASEKKPKKFVL